jgi:hypothetical protein
VLISATHEISISFIFSAFPGSESDYINYDAEAHQGEMWMINPHCVFIADLFFTESFACMASMPDAQSGSIMRLLA